MIFENWGFGLKIAVCSNSNKFGTWQIEHANYEHSSWNLWSWPTIIDSDEFGPNTETCSNFYEIWHSPQIEHANY